MVKRGCRSTGVGLVADAWVAGSRGRFGAECCRWRGGRSRRRRNRCCNACSGSARRAPELPAAPAGGPVQHAHRSLRASWPEDLTAYRTLCVRLCDGFYFPMSNGVRRDRLYRDNRACMQRCDGEARLFYYPATGGSVETMVDLAGPQLRGAARTRSATARRWSRAARASPRRGRRRRRRGIRATPPARVRRLPAFRHRGAPIRTPSPG